VLTWTDNPQREMWHQLGVLAVEANARRLLTGEMSSKRAALSAPTTEIERKARQIAMTVAQAAEFFEAAEQVTIATSPLLLFYGMLSLAKALIIANRERLFLEDIAYHGLHTKTAGPHFKNTAMAAYASDPLRWGLSDEYAITAGGVFKEFAWVVQSLAFPDHSVLKLRDLFSVCPEMCSVFERIYSVPSRCVYAYSYGQSSAGTYQLRLESQEEPEHILSRLPELRTDFTLTKQERLHTIFQSNSTITGWPDYLGYYAPPVGGHYFVGPVPYETYGKGNDRAIVTHGKRYLHPTLVDYAAVFILSNCVRYKQDLWRNAMVGADSGLISLVEIYLSIVMRRFPNLILELFFNEEFKFGTPSYLG
jgi:hypothetical protein